MSRIKKIDEWAEINKPQFEILYRKKWNEPIDNVKRLKDDKLFAYGDSVKIPNDNRDWFLFVFHEDKIHVTVMLQENRFKDGTMKYNLKDGSEIKLKINAILECKERFSM